MPHTIYADETARIHFTDPAWVGVLRVPDHFECEECEDVRKTILAWQEQAEGKCDRGECQCDFHVWYLDVDWPTL